jgi:hypothetical protein
MKDILIYIIIGALFIGLIVVMNKSTNQYLKDKCIASGGTFYYAIDANRSLCEIKPNAK